MPAVAIALSRESPAAEAAPRFTLITGPTSGIGLAMAERLAASGRSLLLACRDVARGEAIAVDLRRRHPGQGFEVLALDLTSFDSVEGCLDEIVARGVTLERLVCNAGVHVPFATPFTADGLELHQQVNCSANLLLVLGLHQRGRLAAGAQVLYIGSEAHRMASLARLPMFGYWRAYARSKENAIASFLLLARQLDQLDIRVLSPGTVDTDVHRHKPWPLRVLSRLMKRYRTAPEAAATLVAAADSSKVAHGDHAPYYDRGRSRPPSARVSDLEVASRVLREALAPIRERLAAPWGSHIVPYETHAGTAAWVGLPPVAPTSTEEICAAIRAARLSGRRVRVVGKLHSYNDCARSDGVTLSLHHLQGIEVDAKRCRARVQAGVSIRALCDALDRAGLTLPWAGNYGEQTFVGAALTGTHGYARAGGTLAELVTAMTVIDGDGQIHTIDDEADLRCLRVSFGAVALVVDVTVAAIPRPGLCRYHLRHVPTAQLLDGLDADCRRHEHYRCFPSRVLPGHHAVLTIDRIPPHDASPPSPRMAFVDRAYAPRALIAVMRLLLASRLFLWLLARTRLARAEMRAHVPFSSFLFINAGITTGNPTIARAIYEAWNDDRTHNASFGVSTRDYRTFHALFHDLLALHRRAHRGFSAYFTARFTGPQDRALLAPNYGRGVLMLDIHVPRGAPGAVTFLVELESRSRAAFTITPHWGKQLFASRDEICGGLSRDGLDALRALKRRLDPQGRFSSPFSERLLGL